MPNAEPAAPSKEYQAYISPRFASGVRWAMVDSSMALNGPISLPLYHCQHLVYNHVYRTNLGLMTPTIAATSSIQ